jgi:hypothetical protein
VQDLLSPLFQCPCQLGSCGKDRNGKHRGVKQLLMDRASRIRRVPGDFGFEPVFCKRRSNNVPQRR